ncbi:haloacid dehalogenase type II [Halocatena salina]|uniref:Haloacid dehalogenase type II n=1 Tax=Halocatena salina TaxID=2934340 RepID=A0A8U0A6I7_9EURY|nr:haloacid dehalogenase type II [Halocatena salina]UPM44479.1 haloacid dehalogenase type II [Halocatena salina]
MALDPESVSVVAFDSYSTIVDVDTAARALSEHTDDAESVSDLWRSRSLSYAMHSALIDTYRPFDDLLRDSLDYALAVNDITVDENEREQILEVYHNLAVFEDVHEGIRRLTDGGYDCYIVSNGTPEMLDSLVEHADIGAYIEETISADEVGIYKPAPEPYREAATRSETPIKEIAYVAAGWWDVRGALHAGMVSVRIDRKGLPWSPYDGTPVATIETFHDLADELGV